jgi:hypothetical protein
VLWGKRVAVNLPRLYPGTLIWFIVYLQIGTKQRADERTRTADLLITSELLKSRESNAGCFSLPLTSQHSIRRHLLETHILRAIGQQGAELKLK